MPKEVEHLCLLEMPFEAPQADEALTRPPSSNEFQAQYSSLYDLLGVSSSATQQEIRVAYRRLALKHHPDKLQSQDAAEIQAATQRFQVLSAAYEELGDPVRRAAYDASMVKGEWSWNKFSWDRGLQHARYAFEKATRRIAEALLADHHDISGHVASRAAAQVAVDLVEAVEISSAKSLLQAGGAAELRSSIAAGEHLAASAAAQSSSKLIPILGALVSGGIDCATTASVGRRSIRVFKL